MFILFYYSILFIFYQYLVCVCGKSIYIIFMSTPLVSIVADYQDFGPYNWHATPEPYIEAAVGVAGVLPVIVPAIGDRLNIEDLLSKVDGVLLSGAPSNVHPSHYGESASASHEPYDRLRDSTTLPLIRSTIDRGIPLLAICRGVQELNVALGGTLTASFQEARGVDHPLRPRDEPLDKRFKIAHDIELTSGCNLAKILNESTVRVNSLHGQALDSLGKDVSIDARASDGTIEAISVDDAPGFVMGVQWHPEYWAKTDSVSHKILSTFGDAVRAYSKAR